MKGFKITGTGSYLPPLVVENQAFSAIVETNDEWIRSRTGIERRHFAGVETTAQMGAKAAQAALDAAGTDAQQVQLLIASSVFADTYAPSLSASIQGLLGNDGCICIDVNCGCTGFVCALDMAARYLHTGDVDRVLIVSAEKLSAVTDFSDRSTCVLFGDGAGACVVERSAQEVFCVIANHPAQAMSLTGISGGQKNPFCPDSEQVAQGCLQMEGAEVYKFATVAMPRSLEQACSKAGISPQDLDVIIPHQANIRIVKTAMKNLGLPMEKAYLNIADTANTSSASIPLALDKLVREQGIPAGSKIAFTGFGAGLSCGTLIMSWCGGLATEL